jgi:hypothetical protein
MVTRRPSARRSWSLRDPLAILHRLQSTRRLSSHQQHRRLRGQMWSMVNPLRVLHFLQLDPSRSITRARLSCFGPAHPDGLVTFVVDFVPFRIWL